MGFNLDALTEGDAWMLVAYDHAWRRVLMHDKGSKLDLEDTWYSDDLVRKAERWTRLHFNRPAPEEPPRASGPDAARMDLDGISWNDMTLPERDLMRPRFLELASALKSSLAAAAARMKRATRSKRPIEAERKPAQEIAPPPGFENDRFAYLHSLIDRRAS